jgi:hypothetical protein
MFLHLLFQVITNAGTHISDLCFLRQIHVEITAIKNGLFINIQSFLKEIMAILCISLCCECSRWTDLSSGFQKWFHLGCRLKWSPDTTPLVCRPLVCRPSFRKIAKRKVL